jgi:sec-independent protein translocase protein TatB
MFDIGFWELALVGLVALLVIGPKDLPRVARKAGLWLGRARRTLASVKQEIDREFKAQELQEILARQARSNPVERILDDAGADPGPPPPAAPPRSVAPRAEPHESKG